MAKNWGASLLIISLFIFSVGLMMFPSYNLLVEPRGQSFDLFWIWAGGRAVLAANNPYGPETTRIIQLSVFRKIIPPDEYQHGFPHPAHITFILLPFIVLPFSWSILLWTSLQIPLLMAVLVLGLKVLGWSIRPYLLFLLAFLISIGFRYPINVYVLGQVTIFVMFCVVLSAWLFQHGRPRWAAVALAGATIRPDLALLAILLAFLLIKNSPKRNEFIITLLSLGLVLLILPALFIGFWPVKWLMALQSYGSNPFATWPPRLLPLFWLRVILLISLAVWWLRYILPAWSRPNFFHQTLLVSATVLLGLISLPQTGSYSLTLALIPALILLYYAQQLWLRVIIAGSLLTPWFYFTLGGYFDTLIFLLIPGQFILFQEIVRRFPRSF